ncbi:hypothetical protein ACFWJY_30175 [Streptomyces anulatus]|uniref:hypothetical protein n=1 Tax=Streptomyces anulatus TaxID=1892 RepID=UPI003666AFC5
MAARTGQHLDHQLGGERGVGLAGRGAALPRLGGVGQEDTEADGEGWVEGRGQAQPAALGVGGGGAAVSAGAGVGLRAPAASSTVTG